MKVLDAAYPAWTIPELANPQIAGVIRYVGDEASSKNMRPREFSELVAAGVRVGTVFETSGTDYVGGYAQGVTDGRKARTAAHGLGFPDSRPIFCTVDRGDGPNPTIVDYERGFNVGAGFGHWLEGFYGDRALAGLLFSAGVVGWYWQTNARGWPGDATDDPRAAIIQRTSKSFPQIPPGSYDESDVFATDWGQYPAPASPVPAPPPPPPTSTHHAGGPMATGYDIFEQAIVALDEHGAGHVPIPGVHASDVFSIMPIATPDPAKTGGYYPIPSVSLTIGADGNAELVLEHGQPHGPASVRACHT